jgi:hypothetical protein
LHGQVPIKRPDRKAPRDAAIGARCSAEVPPPDRFARWRTRARGTVGSEPGAARIFQRFGDGDGGKTA